MSEVPVTLHERFERQVKAAPEAPAVTFGETTLSYRELNERANRLARHLQDCGVGPEILVGLCLDRSLDTVVAILAVLKAGGAYVPMDPVYPDERVRLIVEDAQCPVVLVHEAHRARLSSADSVTLVVIDAIDRPWESTLPDNPERSATADSLLYVMYTSGSTGKPKGVQITHRNVSRLFNSTNHWFNYGNGETWSLFHSYAFDLSVWEIWGALLHGGRVVVVPYLVSRSPEAFYQLLEKEQVTHLCQTPSALRQLQAYEDTLDREDWGKLALRYVVLGGEALSFPSLASWFERHGDEHPRIINMYGITETTIHVTYRRVFQHEAVPDTPSFIGVPIPDQPCYVLDEWKKPVAVGEVGELYVGGAGTARGYFNRPDLTSERFIESPFVEDGGAILYKTGDLVRLLRDDMAYIGRIDNQVQIRGFRVEPSEIEADLLTYEDVAGAAVRAHASGNDDQRLVAYYVSPEIISAKKFLEHLSRKLPQHMMPSAFVRLDSMPLTGNGKTDYRALPEPEFGRDREEPYVAPRNALERALVELWQEILDVESIGVNDNFLELGGHSLLATRILSRIQEQLSVKLPLRLMLASPSVSDLAEAITSGDVERPNGNGFELPEADVGSPNPLSYSQEQLWILTQLHPQLTAYNIPLRITIRGALQVGVLEQALNAVIDRHEVLRTVFESDDGNPEQRVLPCMNVPVAFESLLGLPEDDREPRARCSTLEVAEVPMDLLRGPLLRAMLFEMSQERHCLAIVVHHIVFDGWSISVLLNELADAYHRALSGSANALARLPHQYAAYAAWQRRNEGSAEFESDFRYWKRQLVPPLAALEIPADFRRPDVRQLAGSVVRRELSRELRADIEALARESKVTPYILLLAAWKALLYRYTGHEDCIVGTALAGRNRKEWEPLIGFFVNTVALRTKVARDLSFSQLIQRVQTVVIEAQEHQEVPFERIVSEVQSSRDLSRSPIFQNMFVLHNTPEYAAACPELSLAAEELGNGGAKFDLTLSIQPSGSTYGLNLEYDTALFRRATIELLLGRYETLLSAAVAQPDCSVGELAMGSVGPVGANVLPSKPVEIGGVSRRECECVHELFERQATARPDSVAVTCEGSSVTYNVLNIRANRLAHYLRDCGVGANVLVGLCLDRSIDTVMSILAVLKAGGAYVPMDPLYPAERVKFMMQDAQCSVAIVHGSQLHRLAEGPVGQVLVLDGADKPWETCADTNPVPTARETDLAYVIYTSGSTGQPKGALITHKNVMRLFSEMDSWFAFGRHDVWTLFHSYAFDFSVWEMWGALLHGGCLVVVPYTVSRSPAAFYQLLLDKQVTVLNQTPSAFKQLQFHDETVPAELAQQLSLRYVFIGGESMDLPELRPWMDRHGDEEPQLVHVYGITETTVFVTCRPLTLADTEPGTPSFIGVPIPDLRVYVLDESGQLVGTGESGELYVGGDGVSDGYLNRPELTAERFLPDPFAGPGDTSRVYKTGDLVRVWDGDLEFQGRNDMQVQLRGFRIELGEIESALGAIDGVRGAVVRMREYEPGDKRLVGYYLAKKPLPVPVLRGHLLESLPPFMVPFAFVHLDTFPISNNGKIDAEALPAPTACTGEDEGVGAPQSDEERMVASVWAELFRVSRVGRNDNFFSLGGHSLLAIRLISRLNAMFECNLSLEVFFREPTVAGISKNLEMVPRNAGSPAEEEQARQPMVLLKDGTKNPFFCVTGAGNVHAAFGPLADALDGEQPMYGFSELLLWPDDELFPTVEEMAAKCVREMKAKRPGGPYHIGGYSFGGVVAYEMARQLIESGEEVSSLIMLDTSAYLCRSTGFRSRLFSAAIALNNARVRVTMFAVTWKLQLGYIRDGLQLLCAKLAGSIARDTREPTLRDYLRWIWQDTNNQYFYSQAGLPKPRVSDQRLDMVRDSWIRRRTKRVDLSLNALKEYKFEPIMAEVTMLRVAFDPWHRNSKDVTLGWKDLALQGVRVEVVPGNHLVMYSEPFVRGLGATLQRCLDRAD